MESVLSKVGDMAEFTVIYTGINPSKVRSPAIHNC